MSKSILITGIGGNVGYGILKNIRTYYPGMFRLIGTNTVFISPGNHLCEEVYEVPFSTDPSYIDVIKNICTKHEIALVIPSTDLESYILSDNASVLPPVAASPAAVNKIFLDKYSSYIEMQRLGLPFAQSILPSAYQNEFVEYIVKPRDGRGSRDIHVNPEQPGSFDDSFVVQPLLKGPEITTAFYITQDGNLHGHITMSRKLSSGATSQCEVTFDHDEEMETYIRKLITHIPVRGACNIQSMVTSNGIVPFEVNCRISGTNSIRSHFGFKDVCYSIDELLLNKHPEPVQIQAGAAVRILYDIIYPGMMLSQINNGSDPFFVA